MFALLLIPLALFAIAHGSRPAQPIARRERVSALQTWSAFVRAGQQPPTFVIAMARDEAMSIGDHELAASIAHQLAPLASSTAPVTPFVHAPTLMRSPVPGTSDEAWSAFAHALERETPDFHSNRRVGRYATSKTRLHEIGIDPDSIVGSPDAQDAALASDLGDAFRHFQSAGLLDRYVGGKLTIPDMDEPSVVTLSGILGVASVAGIEATANWLAKKDDRKRFTYTTNLYLRTNGAF